MNKLIKLMCLLVFLFVFLCSCNTLENTINITNGETITLEVGQSIKLDIENNTTINDEFEYSSSNDCATVDNNGVVSALNVGSTIITVSLDEYSDSIEIVVISKTVNIILRADKTSVNVGDVVVFSTVVYPSQYQDKIKYMITDGENYASIDGNILTTSSIGSVVVVAGFDNYTSNTIIIDIKEEAIKVDPYENISKDDFYASYEVASCYEDAMYRSLHGLMSGSILPQDQNPTISTYRPSENGIFYRNTSSIYSEDGNTYYIVNAYGNIVNKIYKGGGYVSLEEVAAYVLAFGDIPANYSSSKKTSPKSSIWGQYLRVNHTSFSGSTTKYPYEPELPNIRGCGGELYYYELDLGTTGTDCDPDYDVCVYNDGTHITRGAARIVYSRYDKNKDNIIDINEKYVFYTNNHYNDFREYLNYEGGWGEIFGNITGGGTLSSKTDYNPTKYIQTLRKDFTK